MIKLLTSLIFVLFTHAASAAKYSGCTDPQYISYVEKRLSFYEKLDRERYEKALSEMDENEVYSYQNIVLSARFDTKEIALNNIVAYENHQLTLVQRLKNSFSSNSDNFHNINIAKGWLALKSGNEDEATSYLFASTKVKGSSVLGSFGPDKTLIRELYKRGKKIEVLKYLELVESFWNTDSAKNKIEIWRKMARNDCSIQFQFYDTTSIKELGL